MGQSMSMDVEQIKQALAILKGIPHDLHGSQGGGRPIADLADTAHLPDDLKGFGANGGSASSWISQCCSELQGYINTLVTSLESACTSIGGQMDNSIKAYTGSDTDSSSTVNNSGAPLTGDGRG